ncbi:MAG TPA: hypothetical protein VNS34_02120 [Rhizobiaceae bacterium]|nr:hypothetical protein [Rhizobiaceae bacterium]
MTTRSFRQHVAALGLVMIPLLASAQPAQIFLDPVSGDCSDLNFRMTTNGVTHPSGQPHPGHWAITTYRLLINGRSEDDHIASNFTDLLQSFSTQKTTRFDGTARLSCLQASNFDIEFQARPSITRIHWDALFPPCQPCADGWANLVNFVNAHERKHLSAIMAAVQAANSQWPRGSPSARVVEVCGPPGAALVRDLGSQLMKEIARQLKETATTLDRQIHAAAIALDSQEPYQPLDCTACRCQVPAECKTVTLSPNVMRGGAPANGDVTLLSTAPSGGADVLLKSDNPAASIPPQINVPQGGTSQSFALTLTPVLQKTEGFVYATRPGAGRICRAEIWVYPPELVLLETPQELSSSDTGQGTVTLGTIAPTGGMEVQLSATQYLNVPDHVIVPAGALKATFEIRVNPPPEPDYNRSEETYAALAGVKLTKVTNIHP